MSRVRNNSKKFKKYSYHTPQIKTQRRECNSQSLRILQWLPKATAKPRRAKSRSRDNNSKNKIKTKEVAKIKRRKEESEWMCGHAHNNIDSKEFVDN